MADTDFSAPLSDTDLERLGLRHDPFVDPTGDFLVADTAFTTQINVSLHMLQVGDRVLLVRGPEGIGKSQFLRRLLERKPSGLGLCLLQGEAGLQLGELVGPLLRSLDLAAREGERLPLEQAVARLGGSARAGVRPVLLLDDADRLAPDVLDQLLDLWLRGREADAFALVLAGGPALDARVEGLQARLPTPETLHQIQLYPYSPQQSVDYLTQALRQAGDREDKLLDGARKRQIHLAAGGVPAKLNREARRALTQGSRPGAAGSSKLRRPLMVAGLAAGALVLAGLLGTYLMQSDPAAPAAEVADDQTPFGLKMPERYAYDQRGEPAVRPGAGAPAIPVQRAPEPAAGPASVPAEPSSELRGAGPQEPGPAAAASDVPASEVSAEKPAAEEMPIEEVPIEEVPIEEVPAEEVPTEEVPAEEAGNAEAAAETANPENSTAPVAGSAESAASFEQRLARGRSWVIQQPTRHYTLQLLAAYDPAVIRGFVQRHGLAGRTAVVRTRRQGRDWYVLLTGHYSTANWAREGLKRLEPQLREHGPWIRSFGSVREDLAP